MMNRETRVCQNCRQNFVIEPEDLAFYEKVSVPPPSWCPECRLQRRLVFMNERTLYKRKCDLCGKDIISNSRADVPYPVYCNSCWWSDKWDPMDYGMEIDFSKPFLQQVKELHERVPWPALHTIESTNVRSEYSHNTSYLKDCYFMFTSDYSENCMYGTCVEHSKDSLDLLFAEQANRCYEGWNLTKCDRVFFSSNCENCFNLMYCRQCIGCSDCFGCTNLRNKKYHIFNRPYSKEEYSKRMGETNLGSFAVHQEHAAKAGELHMQLPHRFMTGTMNSNVSGEYIMNSRNVRKSYQVLDAKDCKYCHFFILGPTTDSYDFTMWGMNASRVYESTAAGGGMADSKFVDEVWAETQNLEYCFNIPGRASNLFGCVGLRSKDYCVLNKQYSKEDYRKITGEIREQMARSPYTDSKGREFRYGEFFPSEFSPFAYNETLAHDYLPLTREQAVERGFWWLESKKKGYEITLMSGDLPDRVEDVEENILKQVIGCAHQGSCNHKCATAFKILPVEFTFYKEYNLPLPRLCPNCRHYSRLAERQPINRLFERKCMCDYQVYKNSGKHSHHPEGRCPNEFETSYAPERPEIVYCERCYNSEVV